MSGRVDVDHSCRVCGYKFNCVESIFEKERRVPVAGSVSLCLRCGALSIFEADLSLRAPTDVEREEILEDTRVVTAIRCIHELELKGRRSPT